MSCCVYLLTFASGKVYVGQTSVSLSARIKGHRSAAGAVRPKCPVHCAWKKYGEPVISVLTECRPCELIDLEKAFISLFNSFGAHGYNMTPGGEISPMLTPATVDKVRALARTPARIARNVEIHLGSKRSAECVAEMSRRRKGQGKGIPKSAEHRAKIGKANLGRTDRIGTKHSAETRAKMSISAIARWANR